MLPADKCRQIARKIFRYVATSWGEQAAQTEVGAALLSNPRHRAAGLLPSPRHRPARAPGRLVPRRVQVNIIDDGSCAYRMGPIGNLEARVAEYPRRGAVAYIPSKAKKWDPNGPYRPPAG